MKGLAQLLRDNADAYRDRVHEALFMSVMESRQIFALSMDRTHSDMAGALAWFLDHCDPWGGPEPGALRALRKLGRDHRRHGFPPEIYDDFARCLIGGLDLFDLSASDRIAGERAIELACAELADAAREADLAGIAPAHQAQVVDVQRPNREIAVVRLEIAMPLDFEPGQYLPVTSRLLPGTWVHLTPAAPANAVGQLEFHIQAPAGAGLDGAALLARSKPGDVWTLGTPRGTFAAGGRYAGRPTFVCFGTGWAAVRAVLLHRVEAATVADENISLDCTVYASATSPGQHYDATVQSLLARLDSALALTNLVDAATDPWLLGATDDPARSDLELVVTPDPVVTLLEREDPRDLNLILVGPAHRVDDAVDKLTAAGVDPAAIEAHPWAHGRDWDPS